MKPAIKTYVSGRDPAGDAIWIAVCPECKMKRPNVVERHAKSGIAVHRRLEHGIAGVHSQRCPGGESDQQLVSGEARDEQYDRSARAIFDRSAKTKIFDAAGLVALLALGRRASSAS